MNNIAIIGSGSWGVALATHLANMGHNVKIWSFLEEERDLINNEKKCKFLPNVVIPDSIECTTSFKEAIEGSDFIIHVTPSKFTRNIVKQYEQYVKEKTPRHNLFLNMCKAFFLGGLICLLGQVIYHYFELRNLSPDECSRWMSLSLILLSVLFTGTGIYQKLAAWGGAGALVPITGFANSVAAPAIEYKKEGQVFGIGCKIFTIAGPVILYGIFTSWGLGLIYWFGTLFK